MPQPYGMAMAAEQVIAAILPTGGGIL